jgi:hypothetical protein
MENINVSLNAQTYNALVSALANMPNHTNTYWILQEIERQAKEQMDAFEAAEKANAEKAEKADAEKPGNVDDEL